MLVTKNKSDYFIHKDLKGFLERELDFFIKNEIMDVDAIATEEEQDVESYLTKVRVIKSVCQKIIQFLAQIEDFQKKLFEKKKFILDDEYCLTLDKIPEEIREEVFEKVLNNQEQLEEWKELYDEDIKTKEDLFINKSSLFDDKSLKNLAMDTKFLDEEFKEKLLSSFESIDNEVEGLMINSENYQALNVLSEKLTQKIKCIYIDPPYNAKSSEILYKNRISD